MKLSDLKLTPTGSTATSKLGRQVWKSTIAAGGEPNTKLGVLGITIGQTQSTGTTSQSSSPMAKYRPRKQVNEAAEGREWPLISKLSSMVGLKLRFDDVDFDHDEAATDAVALVKILLADTTKGRDIARSLTNIRGYLAGTRIFKQIEDDRQALRNFGYAIPVWMQDGLDGNALLLQKRLAIQAHITAVVKITEFLDACNDTTPDDPTFGKDYAFINATLKKLGLR
jgi:hypothetical protein